MKKDIFNGKVKSEYISFMKVSLILGSIVFVGLGIFFLLLGGLNDTIVYEAKIGLLVIGALSILSAGLLPLTTILYVRQYPKHKKLAKFFVKEYVLIDIEDNEENNSF